MFDFVIYLFALIIGGGILLIGIVAFSYGLYSMSIRGFDKSVRNFSIILGIVLISIVTSLYFFFPSAEEHNDQYLIGKYYLSSDPTKQLELKKDGSFIASFDLINQTEGKWKLIEFDEFSKVDISSLDNQVLVSFDIVQIDDDVQLVTDNAFTNVEDQKELIKIK